MKYLIPGITILLLILSGCGDSDNDKGAESALTQAEVHLIEPKDIQEYLDTFKTQRSQIVLEYDGHEYELSFLEPDEELDALFISYSGGVLQVGFDVATEEPLPSLIIYEGDIALLESDSFFENLNRILIGDNISIDEDDADNTIYTGRLRDQSNEQAFDVRLVVNESLINGGTSTIEVEENTARVNGDLGTFTYLQIRELLDTQSNVTRLVLQNIGGSVNDAINMHTGRLVRNAGLNTHVEADGNINSGGVDLFTAGLERTVEEGGILGVHSWCCEEGETADKLPRDHPAHRAQLTFFREMLDEAGEDFYFFTLNAASFKSIHPMTRAEMIQYDVITE